MAADDPTQFCAQAETCTDRMKQITENYIQGDAAFAKENVIATSGACFHLSSMYDGEHEHHGAFLFERIDQDLMTSGIFSFFAPSDPYADMDAKAMKEFFIANKSTSNKTIETPEQIELQFLAEDSDYHYWFRSYQGRLFLIGKQASGYNANLLFCDFRIN